ncbi:MAG: oligosaccharide repeat unit polymerase [Pseudomonadales bacterium]|nr:oligosaccharide repeat unit polymerase [Pseudomonadales bacterium]
MDLIERLLAISIASGILVTGLVVRTAAGTWANPAALFSCFWFLFTFVPLLALPFVPINWLAIAYIWAACLAFAAPVLMFDWRSAHTRNVRNVRFRRGYLFTPVVRCVFVLSLTISVVFVLLDLLIQGFNFQRIVADFFASSNEYMSMRYAGEIRSNPFGQWGLIGAYMCSIFGGLLHASCNDHRERWLYLVGAMLPAVLVMLVQSAKGLFVTAIAIILGAHLLCRVLVNQRPHLSIRGLAKQWRYGFIAVPLLIVAFLSRGLYSISDSDEVVARLIAYLGSYAFLHVYAFSDWFSHAYGMASLQTYPSEFFTYGFYSFVAMFELFGAGLPIPPGTYGEYLAIPGLSPGNIYTIFRGLITDFGLGGSLVFLWLLGIVFQWGFWALLMAKRPVLGIAMYILFIQFLYKSYLISVFIWNSTYLVFVLTVVVLAANRLARAKHSHTLRELGRFARKRASVS